MPEHGSTTVGVEDQNPDPRGHLPGGRRGHPPAERGTERHELGLVGLAHRLRDVAHRGAHGSRRSLRAHLIHLPVDRVRVSLGCAPQDRPSLELAPVVHRRRQIGPGGVAAAGVAADVDDEERPALDVVRVQVQEPVELRLVRD